jgi:hypothetical protein
VKRSCAFIDQPGNIRLGIPRGAEVEDPKKRNEENQAEDTAATTQVRILDLEKELWSEGGETDLDDTDILETDPD